MRCFNLTREMQIPQGALKVADKQSDAIAYVYTNMRDQPCALVFWGKSNKPIIRNAFRNAVERERHLRARFEQRQGMLAYTSKRRADRKAWVNDYRIGDIVNTCWGYDQTNREFYEVVGVKGKHVTLRQVKVASYATGWAQEKVSPLAGAYCGEPFTRLAQERGIKIGKHSHTYATRTSFREAVPGVKVYDAGHTSSYA